MEQIKLFEDPWANHMLTKVQKFESQFKNLDAHAQGEIE
jgi:hypothetical protein